MSRERKAAATVRAGLELTGAAAFIAAAFMVGLIPGLIITGAVCWLAAAFADWGSRGNTQQHGSDVDGAELPEG